MGKSDGAYAAIGRKPQHVRGKEGRGDTPRAPRAFAAQHRDVEGIQQPHTVAKSAIPPGDKGG